MNNESCWKKGLFLFLSTCSHDNAYSAFVLCRLTSLRIDPKHRYITDSVQLNILWSHLSAGCAQHVYLSKKHADNDSLMMHLEVLLDCWLMVYLGMHRPKQVGQQQYKKRISSVHKRMFISIVDELIILLGMCVRNSKQYLHNTPTLIGPT